MSDPRPPRPKPGQVPFPTSLCHDCQGPRFVTSDRGAVFIYCELLRRYPPQPVRRCDSFREASGSG